MHVYGLSDDSLSNNDLENVVEVWFHCNTMRKHDKHDKQCCLKAVFLCNVCNWFLKFLNSIFYFLFIQI